jgi:hypothetical protein
VRCDFWKRLRWHDDVRIQILGWSMKRQTVRDHEVILAARKKDPNEFDNFSLLDPLSNKTIFYCEDQVIEVFDASNWSPL